MLKGISPRFDQPLVSNVNAFQIWEKMPRHRVKS